MKRNSIITGIYFLFFCITVCSFRGTQHVAGQELYGKYCTPCHGTDGTKGKFGAKDLQKSKLADADLIRIITEGRRWMPSWKKKLSPDQIAEVMDFIKTLRKK